ncbi:MAG: hypothetical protein WCT19_01160 [Candidatus Paceibacterota bacterium]|jgi:phosphomannomutase
MSSTNKNYLKLYVDFLRTKADVARPLKVVLDFSNGTASIPGKELFAQLPNLKISIINDRVDGNFPAHGPNPILPGAMNQLSDKVLEDRADLGVVFDADGDRAFFIDERGQFIESHYIAFMLFKNLKPPYVVNEITYKCFERLKIENMKDLTDSMVGRLYITDKMQEAGDQFGAEQSGHYYFKDFFYSDGGILASIKILNFLSRLPGTISEYVATLPKFVLQNIDLETKLEWPEVESLLKIGFKKENAKIAMRDGVTADFQEGFINVRFSLNENLLRIYAGAASKDLADKLVEKAVKIILGK